MTNLDRLPAELAARSAFLVWGPPAYSNRSRLLAAALGMEVHHVYRVRRRGALAAFAKYPYQAVATTIWLARTRPRLLFVQHPPGFAVLAAAIYCRLTSSRFVVDAHSDAFDSRWWTRPRRVYRWLAREAVTTIVTNEHSADVVRSWGADATVVQDIPTEFVAADPPTDDADDPGTFRVAVVATFAPDEPLDAVVAAARHLPAVRFRITGDPNRAGASVPSDLPANVRFTGFVPLPEYHGLLRSSDAVMALTTRDHTMQRGACEALSHGTPIITSRWPLLEQYFAKGTVHVDNSAEGIRAGVEAMIAEHPRHLRDIVALRAEVDEAWSRARDRLLTRVLHGSDAAA